MTVSAYAYAVKNAVQLHPFLSKQDEIHVPKPGEMQFKIKMIIPTVSDTSTSDSGQWGNDAVFPLGITPYPAISGAAPPGPAFSTNRSGSSLILFISFLFNYYNILLE